MVFNGEMAKYQIQDRVREAEAYRATRASRTARTAAQHGKVRRVTRSALAAVLWPVKH